MSETENKKEISYTFDPKKFWNSDEQYNDKDKSYGHFSQDGSKYIVEDINTPKQWLNFMANAKACVATNSKGQGFLAYKTMRLRITKYTDGYDYVPRQFTENRIMVLVDNESGKKYDLFSNDSRITATHSLGYSIISDVFEGDLKAEMKLYIAIEDAVECLEIKITDLSGKARDFTLEATQQWAFLFLGMKGITREISGNEVNTCKNGFTFSSDKIGLPNELISCYVSPEYTGAKEVNWTGYENTYPDITLILKNGKTAPGGETVFHTAVGITEDRAENDRFIEKYTCAGAFEDEWNKSVAKWDIYKNTIRCDIPDKNLERYLNYWFKNQVHLTFYYTRGAITGYRDVLQDTWGFSLLDRAEARRVLIRTLSYMQPDGVCPRQYDMVSGCHDMAQYMDSGSWIAMPLTAYIKETGDVSILDEVTGYINSDKRDTVRDHVLAAMNMLYEKRGQHGCCLAGDGDWNDALEGIRKSIGAESVWLTMALVNAQNLLAELFDFTGEKVLADEMRSRSAILKDNINKYAWDGDWYVYAILGDGTPIGSHKNKEGKIHLNAQTWAMFTGIADEEKCKKIYAAIEKHLATPIGPMLLYPPYIEENVGRIVYLRPGTFENASVYQHAVSFKVMADAALGKRNTAYQTFSDILPVSRVMYDNMRASEPYCTGNFYNGITSPRFGQNYYGWFTGNAAWFMKLGFEDICGVAADYEGLRVAPMGPDSWDSWSVEKDFRGTRYTVRFERVGDGCEKGVFVDGVKIAGNIVKPEGKSASTVTVKF